MKQWLESSQVLRRLAELSAQGQRAALATVVRVRGSAYRREGAKMIVGEDGSTTGNVSGGCLEEDVVEVGLRVLRTGVPELRSYCSGSDEVFAWDLGVGCEGEVEVYVEPVSAPGPERALLDGDAPFAVCTLLAGPGEPAAPARLVVGAAGSTGTLGSPALDDAAAALARERMAAGGGSGICRVAGGAVFVDLFTPPPRLVIIGAGDDARPLARFGAEIGFRVVVADRRPGLLAAGRFPGARLVHVTADELEDRLALDADSYVVLMTHSFADDSAYLRALVRTPAAYLGVLGPRQRTERILDAMDAQGIAVDEQRVYGPVGLDIGSEGAEQVALSVLGEVLAVRSGRRAGPLRDRVGAIHARSA